MNPASTTTSGACDSTRSASASSKAARSPNAAALEHLDRESEVARGAPQPAASAATADHRARSAPASARSTQARAIAAMFEPRPEIRTTILFISKFYHRAPESIPESLIIQGFARPLPAASADASPMEVFRLLPPAEQRTPCALTIGNFDGVHRGHQAVLARLVGTGARARACRPACSPSSRIRASTSPQAVRAARSRAAAHPHRARQARRARRSTASIACASPTSTRRLASLSAEALHRRHHRRGPARAATC